MTVAMCPGLSGAGLALLRWVGVVGDVTIGQLRIAYMGYRLHGVSPAWGRLGAALLVTCSLGVQHVIVAGTAS